MTPAVDAPVGGRYHLEELIASGGMGQVWRARDAVLGRPVALKLLRGELSDDATFRQRLRAEARHTAALTHPGIAQVYDFGEHESDGRLRPYMVMELVPGKPLSQILDERGSLGLEGTLMVIGQVAMALQAAHVAGVVHRDVKPGNILVQPDGTVKVTDFGIARAGDSATLTGSDHVMGSAHYLSPEQAANQPATPASDIFSLGIVAFECLTGRRPFPDGNPVEVAAAHVYGDPEPLPASVPAPVRRLVQRTLAKDPRLRPPTVEEVGRRFLALHQSGVADADAASRAAVATSTAEIPVVDPDPTGDVSSAPAHPEPSSTTRVLTPPAGPEGGGLLARAGGARRRGRRRAAAPEASGRRVLVIAAAVGLLLVLVVAALMAGDGDPYAEGGAVQVPSMIGSQEDDARSTLAELGLAAEVRQADSDEPRGQVVEQSPRAAADVDPGSTVLLTVSNGPRTVRLNPDDYIGRSYDEVKGDLEGLGLTVARREVDGEDPGTVTAVEPTEPTEGGTVTVTVVADPSAQTDENTDVKPDKPGKGEGRKR